MTESPFGIDPFEPVRHARVTELIGEQTDVPAHSFPTLKEGEAVPEQEGILVFDAGSLDDLASTGRALFRNGRPRLMAGCAGFAALLPDLMKMTERRTVTMPKLDPRLLVACGSVNSITLRQLDVAEQNGFSRLRLTPRQKLDPGYWESENGKEALQGINEMLAANPRCIIETNDEGGTSPRRITPPPGASTVAGPAAGRHRQQHRPYAGQTVHQAPRLGPCCSRRRHAVTVHELRGHQGA